MKKLFLCVLFFFLAPLLYAGSWHTSKVQQIYPTADGSIIVTFAQSSADCERNDKYHYLKVGANGITAESQKNMYSLLLAAAAQAKPVSVFFDNDSSNKHLCAINRLYVNYNQ